MAFDEKLPKWDNVGVEPPESKKTEGWQPTEKPPAQWFNWIFNRIYKTLEEIRTKAVEKETGKGLSTNDYTTVEKTKLADIEIKANKTVIANNLTETVVGKALDATQGKALNDSLVEHKVDYTQTIANIQNTKVDKSTLISYLAVFTPPGISCSVYYAKNDVGTLFVNVNALKTEDFALSSTFAIGTLPEGYRPATVLSTPINLYDTDGFPVKGATALLRIQENGDMAILTHTASSTTNAKRVASVTVATYI